MLEGGTVAELMPMARNDGTEARTMAAAAPTRNGHAGIGGSSSGGGSTADEDSELLCEWEDDIESLLDGESDWLSESDDDVDAEADCD
jgi:hypothetical protein